MSISPEQSALEAWWSEDPEMRRAEIICGESYRINVRLWQIDGHPSRYTFENVKEDK